MNLATHLHIQGVKEGGISQGPVCYSKENGKYKVGTQVPSKISAVYESSFIFFRTQPGGCIDNVTVALAKPTCHCLLHSIHS